jgi:hypothetical protein
MEVQKPILFNENPPPKNINGLDLTGHLMSKSSTVEENQILRKFIFSQVFKEQANEDNFLYFPKSANKL